MSEEDFKVALQTRNKNIIEAFIKYNVKLDLNMIFTDEYYTPLIYAYELGKIEIVQLLLDEGADVNVQGRYGDTALMIASYKGHKEIVQLLLEKGADKRIKNDRDKIAYEWATTKEIKALL